MVTGDGVHPGRVHPKDAAVPGGVGFAPFLDAIDARGQVLESAEAALGFGERVEVGAGFGFELMTHGLDGRQGVMDCLGHDLLQSIQMVE